MRVFRDHIGREVKMDQPAKRIVSLVPSQTELLSDFGLDAQVVGITKFCVHPVQWFKTKKRIGGTKNPKIERILELKPDLVIANKEENRREDILELSRYVPVWVSDVTDFESALDMIKQVGLLTGRENEADHLIHRAKVAVAACPAENLKKAVYLIWKNPYISIGGDTFISKMLPYFGYENSLQHKARYPEVSISEISDLQPEIILLSSEPFPFNEKHKEELRNELPGIPLKIVDGEKHSWYGSRMVRTLEELANFHSNRNANR